MPAEKFYSPDAVTSDAYHLAVTWGSTPEPQVLINDSAGQCVMYDRSGLNRLIKALRKARDQVYGADE